MSSFSILFNVAHILTLFLKLEFHHQFYVTLYCCYKFEAFSSDRNKFNYLYKVWYESCIFHMFIKMNRK
jgi:hypothetical protein